MTSRPDAYQISVGDSLKWRLPSGIIGEATVGAIRDSNEDGIDFYDEKERVTDGHGNVLFHTYRRCIKTDWLTHFRGRRLRRPESGRQGEDDGLSLTVDVPRQTSLTLGKEAAMATKSKSTKKAPAKKSTTKKASGNIPAGSRKSLDDMSDSHRKHIEFWAPHQENLRAEFVWVAIRRFPERSGDGLFYVAIKRGDQDYAIVSYDTSKPTKITKRNVMDEGFETSSAMMEAFKEYRRMAKEERNEARAKANPPKAKTAKASTKSSPAAKKAAAAAGKKRTVKKPPARKKAPARAEK